MNEILVRESQKELDAILARIQPDLDKMVMLKNVITAFGPSQTTDKKISAPTVKRPSLFSNAYDPAVEFVKEFGRFIKGKEIENGISYKGKTAFASVLADAKKSGKLVVYKVNNSNAFAYWGLPEWIGEDEKPKEEYNFEK